MLETSHKENWKEILPVFIIGDDKESKSIYPQMDRAIEKSSAVIDRHSMVIKKKEENKWIKYNYFVVGQAYFYKHNFDEARKVFDFIVKQYKDEPIRNDAILWLARTRMELDEMGKALSLLKLLDDESDLSQDLISDFRATYADYYIRQEQYNKAIVSLEESIMVTKKKDRKARLIFILAQINEIEGQSATAITNYKKVVKLHPNYEMVFYASINQALAFRFRDGESESIKKLLNKMLKDHKNAEYYDQIYYAMAEIELTEGNKDLAIDYFIKSAEVSISNTEQKGISFMTLGNIYLEDKVYKKAKIYFDSTIIFLPKEHVDYEKIEDLDKGLSELIINLDVLQLQDSLIWLAGLSQKEREDIIIALIAAEEEAEEQRLLAEAAEGEDNFGSPVDKSVPLSSQGNSSQGKGDWYFYNPGTMSSGYTEFRQRWGDRKLKDNWRRAVASSSQAISTNDIENLNPSDQLIVSSNQTRIKTMDEYLAEIPFTEEQHAEAEKLVEDALYNAGVIYNEKLDDVDNAIEMFDELTSRFQESEYLITAYYQLYRLYVKKEVEGNYFGGGYRDNSEYYRNIILTDYPYSEYAKIIRNPNYLKEAELTIKKKEEDYMATYRNYKSHRYNIVLDDCNKVIKEDQENPFLPKYYFMKAMIVGSLSDQANFERELQLLADNFPSTEEGDKAVEILNQLNKKGLNLPNEGETEKTVGETDIPKTDFDTNKNAEHFFAIVYPNTKGNVNKVKVAISNFNKKFYSNDQLKVTNSFVNKDNQIIIVRRFKDVERAMSYYNNFVNDDEQLKKVNDENFVTFLISSKNFTKLFKSGDIEGYDLFFQENYL